MFISLSHSQIDLYSKDYYSVNRDSIGGTNNAMIKSFLIPGWGQIHNNEPFWKPATFLGLELLGILSIYNYNNESELIRHDFEYFADQHWSLETWYNNTKKIFPNKWKEILIGTHKLELKINGNYYYRMRYPIKYLSSGLAVRKFERDMEHYTIDTVPSQSDPSRGIEPKFKYKGIQNKVKQQTGKNKLT